MAEAGVGPQEQSGETQEFYLRDWLRILRKWRRLILIAWAVVVAAGAIYTFRSPKMYLASGRLVIWGEVARALPYGDPYIDEWRSYDWWQTQIRLVKARPVMERALKALGDKVPELAQAKDREGFLLAGVDVKSERDNRVATVTFEYGDPGIAAEVVNAVMEGFLEEQKRWRERTAEGTEDWLAGEVPKARDSVKRSEDTLRDFQNKHGIFSADPSQIPAYMALQSIGRREAELTVEKHTVESSVKRLEDAGNVAAAQMALRVVRNDSRILENERILRDLQLRRLAVEPTLANGHVELKGLDRQIEIVEARQREVLGDIARELREEARRIEIETAKLKEEREKREHQIERYTGLFLESERLKSEVKQTRDRYEEVVAGRFRSGISGRGQFEAARVVEYAHPPNSPSRPRVAVNLFLSVLLGLVLSMAAAYAAERLDDSIKSGEQLAEYTGLPMLGLVPHMDDEEGKGDRAALSLLRPRSQPAEAFRMLRANLDLALPAREGGHVYLVTSAVPSEGKTTVAGNLAIVEALNGKRVLLVDADLRHPSRYEAFGIPPGMGLSHYLSGVASREQVIRPSRLDGLDVLCAGTAPPNPAELVGGGLLVEFLAWARGIYGIVLLDSPPVLSVADPLIISRVADGALLVVHAGRTSWMAVRKARETLEASQGKVLGAVLNDSSAEIKRYESYYGYYSHGYYYGEKGRRKRASSAPAEPVETPPGGQAAS